MRAVLSLLQSPLNQAHRFDNRNRMRTFGVINHVERCVHDEVELQNVVRLDVNPQQERVVLPPGRMTDAHRQMQ